MSATVSDRAPAKPRSSGSARALWLKIHRWLGLTLAAFVVIAGVTGVLLPFHDDLEVALNPQLFRVQPQGERLSPFALRERAEALVPQARVNTVSLDEGPEDAAVFFLSPRIDPATDKPYVIAERQLFVNPYTGELIAQRNPAKIGLGREEIMESVFKLHRYLLMGKVGSWILMPIAIAWFVSSIIGFYLTLPPSGRRFFPGWKPAWRVQWSAPLPRFSFDLHRATGLWLWIMVMIVSFGAMRVSLGDVGLLDPILEAVAPVADPGKAIEAAAQPIEEPKLSWEDALAQGRHLMAQAAQREGFTLKGEAALALDRDSGVYSYTVRSSEDAFDSGETEIYFSAIDGREITVMHPNKAAGNALASWAGALHRARIGGVPYKLLVSLTAIATTTLAITGFIVWLKRRRPARRPAT